MKITIDVDSKEIAALLREIGKQPEVKINVIAQSLQSALESTLKRKS